MAENPPNDIIEVPLHKLKPHPLNTELYHPRADWEIAELAADMAQIGQTEPLEVTPTYEIISGHGRLAAAKLLKWKKLKCRIRHDLFEAGPDAIAMRLIE